MKDPFYKIVTIISIVSGLLSCILAATAGKHDLAAAWGIATIWASLYYRNTYAKG